MRIQEDTIPLFDQDKQYVLSYLKSRGLTNRELVKVILDNPFGLLENMTFNIGGEIYSISHLLSKSDVTGYDIRKVNQLLETEASDEVVFALVLGDDALCCNVKSKAVYLWRIQSGNGEKIKISDSLTKFIKKINNTEETAK